MAEPDPLRISNDDRQQFADRLRSAYGEGRITEQELEDRLQAVYEARFESDLVAVTNDLPAPIESPPTISRAGEMLSGDARRTIRSALQWYFPALICTAIWAITDLGGYFWPIWVFLGLSIPFISSLIFDGGRPADDGEEPS